MNETIYQCKGCHLMWDPMRRSYMECPRCERDVCYEALDTWCNDVNEIETDKLRAVVAGIVGASYMEWARRLGQMESCR